MSDAKVTTVEPFPEDSDSARKCIACGHEQPHDRGEYEDTHIRCRETFVELCPCPRHAKRYSKRCDERGEQLSCYSYRKHCDCSSEDRVIAEMRAFIREAAAILGDRCACGHFEVQHSYEARYKPMFRRVTSCEVESCDCERPLDKGAEGGGS